MLSRLSNIINVFIVSAAGWNGYILPTFRKDTKTNVTAYIGKTAVLPCSIINLGTKKVSYSKYLQAFCICHCLHIWYLYREMLCYTLSNVHLHV
jgi:hypothetical protein